MDQRAAVIVLDSEGSLRAAENNSLALIAAAEAENTAAPQLEVRESKCSATLYVAQAELYLATCSCSS